MPATRNHFSLRLVNEDALLVAQSGEVVLVTGPVGSGKTLFLHQIAGLKPLPGGVKAQLDGEAWPAKSSQHQVRMHFDHTPPLWMGQSAGEELLFALRSEPGHEAITTCLSNWRLTELPLETDTQKLNRLDSVRLTLAAMELAQPKLALIDNPTASLPEEDGAQLKDDIVAWARRGNCVVVVACNRWHDWASWIDQMWRIPGKEAWPVAEPLLG
jgi:heme exporter protein A